MNSGDFHHLKNIGKVQPMNDIKLNESIIRSKLNRGSDRFINMNKLESPLKYDQVMINITRGSNLKLIPLSEAVSPTHSGNSPLEFNKH